MGDAQPSVSFVDGDPIAPVRIEHKVDEIIIGGRVDQRYNYIDYWFDSAAGPMRARAYLDGPALEAAIYPPVRATAGDLQIGEDARTRDLILGYLARRYLVIKEVTLQGYQVVWMALHAKRALQHFELWSEEYENP